MMVLVLRFTCCIVFLFGIAIWVVEKLIVVAVVIVSITVVDVHLTFTSAVVVAARVDVVVTVVMIVVIVNLIVVVAASFLFCMSSLLENASQRFVNIWVGLQKCFKS